MYFLGLGNPGTVIVVDLVILLNTSEAYSEPCERSKMKLFAKITFVWWGSEYAYVPQPAIACSKLTIETLELGASFEHILTPCSSPSVVNFEQVYADWDFDRCAAS